ncbi:MAG: hypothetical protein K0R54_661 [Clostridiaceae bacterium]|jgi:hypothetical protein|nr:hypothetical protein [Clostridiaceae bacterium]
MRWKKDNNNYNKNSKYLVHYELKEILKNAIRAIMPINLILLTIFFIVGYPKALKAYDIDVAICSMIFFGIIFPMIRTGKIEAYYRRNYYDLSTFITYTLPFTVGAVIRGCILIALEILLTFVKIYKNKPIGSSIIIFIKSGFDWMLTPIAILAFILVIFLLFYHDKYATVKYLSNSVVDIYNSTDLAYIPSFQRFNTLRDRELGLNKLSNFKRDSDVKPITNNTTMEQPSIIANINENTVESIKEIINEESYENSNIRRKARK